MPTEQLDKKECKNHSQIYADNLNTPSLIRTITVGFGIAPNPALSRPRTVTADREFHPALKTLSLFNCVCKIITCGEAKVNSTKEAGL